MLTRMLLAVSLVCATVCSVQAQSAEPPTFAVGDTWKRSQGIEITVVKSDNDGSVRKGFLATCPDCLSHFNKDNNLVDVTDPSGKPVDVTSLPNVFVGSRWKLFRWPLQVGKSWSFSADGAFRGSITTYNVDITVKAYEEVRVPAGVFKAYKMEQNWSRLLLSGPVRGRKVEWRTIVWYAPDVKSNVKFTTSAGAGTDWELVSYSLK